MAAQRLQDRRHRRRGVGRARQQVEHGALGRAVLLRPVLLRDVLDDARDALGRAVLSAHELRADLGPADGARRGHDAVAMAHEGDLAGDQRPERARVGDPVVRVDDVPARVAGQRRGLVARRGLEAAAEEGPAPSRSVWKTVSRTPSTIVR